MTERDGDIMSSAAKNKNAFGRVAVHSRELIRFDVLSKESLVIKKNGTAYILPAPNADGSSLEMGQDLRRTKPGTKPIGRALDCWRAKPGGFDAFLSSKQWFRSSKQ